MVGDDTSDQTQFTQAIGLAGAEKALTSTDTGVVTGLSNYFFNTLYMHIDTYPPLSQANFAYDGVTHLALAIDKAGSTVGDAIAKNIKKITRATRPCTHVRAGTRRHSRPKEHQVRRRKRAVDV